MSNFQGSNFSDPDLTQADHFAQSDHARSRPYGTVSPFEFYESPLNYSKYQEFPPGFLQNDLGKEGEANFGEQRSLGPVHSLLESTRGAGLFSWTLPIALRGTDLHRLPTSFRLTTSHALLTPPKSLLKLAEEQGIPSTPQSLSLGSGGCLGDNSSPWEYPRLEEGQTEMTFEAAFASSCPAPAPNHNHNHSSSFPMTETQHLYREFLQNQSNPVAERESGQQYNGDQNGQNDVHSPPNTPTSISPNHPSQIKVPIPIGSPLDIHLRARAQKRYQERIIFWKNEMQAYIDEVSMYCNSVLQMEMMDAVAALVMEKELGEEREGREEREREERAKEDVVGGERDADVGSGAVPKQRGTLKVEGAISKFVKTTKDIDWGDESRFGPICETYQEMIEKTKAGERGRRLKAKAQGKKEIKCDEDNCGNIFKLKSMSVTDVARHILIHTGELPFQYVDSSFPRALPLFT